MEHTDLAASDVGPNATGLSRDAREARLGNSLTGLSYLAARPLGLTGLLVEVAALAVQAIPGADGAGLTLRGAHGPDVIVMTTEFVGSVDEIQYSLGEGPSITAITTGETMRSGSLGGDRRWPRFGPRAGRVGVHSTLSLPLQTPAGVLGTINVYAHVKNAFDSEAQSLGERYAASAAIAVKNAHILAQAQRLTQQLQTALNSRPVIDQAIGILRSRSGGTAAEAFEKLKAISQTEHRKLSQVAATIVETSAARARTRRA